MAVGATLNCDTIGVTWEEVPYCSILLLHFVVVNYFFVFIPWNFTVSKLNCTYIILCSVLMDIKEMFIIIMKELHNV